MLRPLASCTVVLLSAWSATYLTAAGTLSVFERNWTVPDASDWRIDTGQSPPVLHLEKSRGPLPGPRRPIQFALADTPPFQNVTVEADAMPLGRSLIIVFGYRDAAHFDYAHLSTDTGAQQPVHNGVFHVYGGERVRISSEHGPAAFPQNHHWYHVKLTYDGHTGHVAVSVDGKPVPALEAVDMSLGAGKVGIGSFDETADFRNVKITGEASN